MSKHRRGRGEGSIYKRSDGRWAGAVTVGYRNGTQHRKTIYGRTRKQVQERIHAALQHQAQGIPLPGERQIVRDYLTQWLSDVVKSRVRARTYESYDSTVRLHIQPYLGRVSLAKLTPQRVQTWLNDLAAAGASPRTCQYARVVVRTALNQALKWNLVVRNAAALKRFSDSPCTAWARRGTSACTNAGGPMQAYSMDLRERALLDSDAGMKAADVAVKYRVSGSWVRLLKQRRRETGEVAPRVQRHGRRRMLEPHLHTLAALIAEQPDRTLAELKDALGTPASLATIWRAVAALDVTVKKNGPARRTRST